MKKMIIGLFCVVVGFFLFQEIFAQQQIIERVSDPACSYGYLNCDTSTINGLVDRGVTIKFFSDGKLIDVKKSAPFIVRLTVFLMRLTALLAVTSMIIAGLSYIWAQGDDKTEKGVLDRVKRIVIGLLLMSASTTIITLIISVFSNSSVSGALPMNGGEIINQVVENYGITKEQATNCISNYIKTTNYDNNGYTYDIDNSGFINLSVNGGEPKTIKCK